MESNKYDRVLRSLERRHIAACTGITGRSGQKCDRRRRQRCALMRTEQHVSAPRRGQLAVLTACADAMRDLPLRKMPEEVILASQRR
jgi:hypothetical protein